MSTGQFLAGGGASEQVNFVPGWYEDYQQRLTAASLAQAQAPYTPYGGPRLAGTSQQTQQVRQRVQDRFNAPTWQPYTNMATATATAAASPLNNQDLQQYMNPFMGNVVGNTLGRMNENFFENVLPSVYSDFTGGGQAGSAREFEYKNRALRDFGRAQGETVGNLMYGGFNTAVNNLNADKSRLLSASGAFSQLGNQVSGLDRTDTAALQAVGSDIENREQQGLDLAYQDFSNQRDWNWNNINRMNAVLTGQQVPTNSATTSMTPVTGMSPLQLLAGAYGTARLFGGGS